MFRFSYAAKVGLIFIVAIFLGMMVLDALGYDFWRPEPTGGYRISVLIESAKGLKEGSDVEYNGYWIGEVINIDRSHFGNVEVVILVNNARHVLHENAYFSITKDSFFGSSLLYISEPKGGLLKARGEDDPNLLVIDMPAGETILHSDVYYHSAAIGSVVDIVKNPDDNFSDIIIIEMKPEAADRINEEQTFVSTRQRETRRPRSGSLSGIEEVVTGRIDIYDRISPGEIVEGKREPGPEDLVISANELVQTTGRAMSDVSDSLSELVANLNSVLTSFNLELTGDAEGTIKAELILAMKELKSGLENVEQLSGDLSEMILEAKQPFNDFFVEMESAAVNIEEATGKINEFVSDDEMTESLKNTIENLEASTEEVLKTIEEIEALVTDDEMQEDIKELVSGAREVVDKVNETIDVTSESLSTVMSTDLEGELRVRYMTEPESVATDLEFTLIPGPNQNVFYRIGMDDIGEIDGFNFQLGYAGSTGLAGRFGIKRGEVGAGFDFRSGPFTVRGDAYDPNDLHLDIYTGLDIYKNISLILGFEDLYDENYFHVGVATQF